MKYKSPLYHLNSYFKVITPLRDGVSIWRVSTFRRTRIYKAQKYLWSTYQRFFSLRIRSSILISLFLLMGLIFSNINSIAHVVAPKKASHMQRIHIHLQPSLPIPNSVFAAQAIYNAQVSSQIDRLLTQKVQQQHFSGSVLISRSNQIILQKGYSMANWQLKQPNTPHTRFYLGSTSKQFTAMAILLLHEQRKLRLHISICMYISPCPSSWQPVTIHEILMHTSGIPALDDDALPTTSPQAWINGFNAIPLVFLPSSQYSYCSICYQVLGYVVEQVSHMPFCSFLQQAIFTPLQMKDTGCNAHYTAMPTHAVGYDDWQNADVTPDTNDDPQWSFLSGSGLLYSTVTDMYRWDQALMHHTLVSQHTQEMAFTPYISSQYAGSYYGYGWFITQGPVAGHRLIWHDGKISGFRTYNGLYPDDHITLIILSNLTILDEMALANEIQQIIFAYAWPQHSVYTSNNAYVGR